VHEIGSIKVSVMAKSTADREPERAGVSPCFLTVAPRYRGSRATKTLMHPRSIWTGNGVCQDIQSCFARGRNGKGLCRRT